MRIIDKNTDFYDYYQNVYKDDTFTFDRRDSFILTKEVVCQNLDTYLRWSWRVKNREYKRYHYMLLQICNTFWLFLIEVTQFNDWGRAEDYNIELLTKWKNFNKPRKLYSLDIVDFYFFYGETKEDVYQELDKLVKDIDINNYKHKRNLNYHRIQIGQEYIEKHIPLLKACGIANCIDAHDVYLALEEYFSLEKSASERREPIGTTDIDKIESHGFDKKVSFRGK